MRNGRTATVAATLVAAAALGVTGMVGVAGGTAAAAHRRDSAVSHKSKNKGKITLVEGGSNAFSDGDIVDFIAILKRDGYTVTADVITTSATALRTVIAGKADFAVAISASEAISSDENAGANLKILATDYQASNYDLLALPKYNLHNITGATLGIAAPGTSTQTIVEAALKAKNVTPNSVKYVDIGGTSARITAILSGSIDLAPALATSAIPALATGKVKLLLNTGPALGPYQSDALEANATYISKNPKLVQTVVDAAVQSERWATTHENKYLKIMDKVHLTTSLNVKQQKALWLTQKKTHYNAINGGMCAKMVQHSLKIDYETGALTRAKTKATPKSEYLDPKFVNNYLKQHGQAKTKTPSGC